MQSCQHHRERGREFGVEDSARAAEGGSAVTAEDAESGLDWARLSRHPPLKRIYHGSLLKLLPNPNRAWNPILL